MLSTDGLSERARRELLAAAIAEKKKRDTKRLQGEPHGGLLEFVRYFWPIVEPARPLIEGWPLEAICEHLEAVTRGEIKRLTISIPPGFMKALDCDTPVLTTWGWKRHGDLRPGDFVFGPDGQPKRVLGNTTPGEEESYEVEFDDGAVIVAGKGHLWEVQRDLPYAGANGKRCRRTQIVTTPELIKTNGNEAQQRADRIPLALPPQMPPKRLLIDPYLLGAWLGDGATGSGVLYAGDQDVDHFKKLGYVARVHAPTGTRKKYFYRIGVDELQVKLRILGLLGNKHIPYDYLEASADQRWALLQGLMDTDGCAAKQGGHCSFTSKLKHLAEQTTQLAASLGMKACLTEKTRTFQDKPYGPYYTVTFTAPTGATVFRLDRKQSRLRGNMNDRSRVRYVRDVRPVGFRTVNCITVEGALYLAGNRFVTTHNSLTANVFYPAYQWGPVGSPGSRFITASYSQSLTVRDNVRFRNIIMHELYRELWGDVFGPSRDQFNIVKVANDKTGWKLATSVGGVGTGERGDFFVIDDGNSVKEVESETVRESTNQWFSEVVPTRLNDADNGVILNIQQRTHENDITGLIISKDLGYDVLCIPMEYESNRPRVPTTIGWLDPRTEDGELAWPERFSPQAVSNLKKVMGPYAVSGQFQQTPTPRGGGILKREWWQLWEAPRYPQCRYVWASADTAYTEKEENDPTGFTVWGLFEVNSQPNIILMDAWRKRLELHLPQRWEDKERTQEARLNLVKTWQRAAWAQHNKVGGPAPVIAPATEPWASFIETGAQNADRWPTESYDIWMYRTQEKWGLCEWLAHSCRKFKVHDLFIEGKASGLTVAQELRRLHGREGWGIHTVTPEGDKVARAYAIQSILSAGLVWAPDREWAELVIEESSNFPKGRYKDLTDSMTQALKHVREQGLLIRPEERSMIEEDLARLRPKQTLLYPV